MATHELKTQFFKRPIRPQPPAPADDHFVTPDRDAAPAELYFPAAAVPRQRPSRRGLLVGMLLVAALAVFIALASGGALLYFSNLIVPGVQVMDTLPAVEYFWDKLLHVGAYGLFGTPEVRRV